MAERITMQRAIVLVVQECHKCGVTYGMTEAMYQRRLDDGEAFYCPNGHGEVFTESRVQRLTRDLQIANQQIARAEDERNEAARREAGAKRETDRIKKRVHGGVCPCCKRTFSQLAKHMQTKHPDVPFVPGAKPAQKRGHA